MREFLDLLCTGNWRGLFLTQTNNPVLQLFRYCFVGGGAFVIDFGAYCLLGSWGIHYLIAGIISFVLGFAFNFWASRCLIFHSNTQGSDEARELVAVIIVSVIGLILTEILLFIETTLFQVDYRTSKIIASILVLFWNYAARKMFIYKDK